MGWCGSRDLLHFFRPDLPLSSGDGDGGGGLGNEGPPSSGVPSQLQQSTVELELVHNRLYNKHALRWSRWGMVGAQLGGNITRRTGVSLVSWLAA